MANMRFTASPPKDAKITDPPKSDLELPSQPGLYTVTIYDMINWAMTGLLYPYVFNRGDGIVNSEVMRHISQNLNPYTLGEFSISFVDPKFAGEGVNGKPENKTKKVPVIPDAHSRLMGMIAYHCAGRFLKPPNDLIWKTVNPSSFELNLRVIPEEIFLDCYVAYNYHKGQSARQGVINPHLCYGNIVEQQVLPLLPDETQQFYRKVGKKWLCNISYIIYSLATKVDRKDQSSWNYPDVYCRRGSAKKLTNTVAPMFVKGGKNGTEAITISKVDAQSLADAITHYHAYAVAIDEQSGPVNVDKNGIRAAGWFGLVVTDHLAAKPRLAKNPSTLAKQFLRRYNELNELVPILAHGTKELMEQRVTKAIKLLKNR